MSVFENTDFSQVATAWESKVWKYHLASQGLPHSTEESLSHCIIVAA